MNPTREQIALTAFGRWQQRGYGHGQHEEDWLAAEQAARFAANYRVVAHYPRIAEAAEMIGRATRPVCRFCEQAVPRAHFSGPRTVAPVALGTTWLTTADVCDDCHAQFTERLGPAVDDFLLACAGPDLGREEGLSMGPAAHKGLVQVALAILPRTRLELCPDTLEWVGNPADASEALPVTSPDPIVHLAPWPFQAPWLGVAEKTDPDAPYPHLIAFLGGARFTIEYAVPLCAPDEDFDGAGLSMPAVPVVDAYRWPGPTTARRVVLVRPRRRAFPRAIDA